MSEVGGGVVPQTAGRTSGHRRLTTAPRPLPRRRTARRRAQCHYRVSWDSTHTDHRPGLHGGGLVRVSPAPFARFTSEGDSSTSAAAAHVARFPTHPDRSRWSARRSGMSGTRSPPTPMPRWCPRCSRRLPARFLAASAPKPKPAALPMSHRPGKSLVRAEARGFEPRMGDKPKPH